MAMSAGGHLAGHRDWFATIVGLVSHACMTQHARE